MADTRAHVFSDFSDEALAPSVARSSSAALVAPDRLAVDRTVEAADRVAAMQAREHARTAPRPIENPWWLAGGGSSAMPPSRSEISPSPQENPVFDLLHQESSAELWYLNENRHVDRQASTQELVAALGAISAARAAVGAGGSAGDDVALQEELRTAVKDALRTENDAAENGESEMAVDSDMPTLEAPV